MTIIGTVFALLVWVAGPQALTMSQPRAIVPPPPLAEDVASSMDDQDRKDIIAAELEFGNEELRDSWHQVATSPNGSVWYIRGKDLGAWTPTQRTVWVKVDHSRDNIIAGSMSLELRFVDCASKRDGAKLSSMYDKDGKQTGRYVRSGPGELIETFPATPGRAVVDAFCSSASIGD